VHGIIFHIKCVDGAGYTLSLWLKLENGECSHAVPIISTQSGISLVYEQDGSLHFKSGLAWLVEAEGVVSGRWHHVTVTWSSTSGLYLYIDGKLAGTGR